MLADESWPLQASAEPAVAMQDESLRLWDVRMAAQSGLGGSAPACLHVFEGHREAVAGVAVHGLDAVSFAGLSLGVFSLQASAHCSRCTLHAPCWLQPTSAC